MHEYVTILVICTIGFLVTYLISGSTSLSVHRFNVCKVNLLLYITYLTKRCFHGHYKTGILELKIPGDIHTGRKYTYGAIVSDSLVSAAIHIPVGYKIPWFAFYNFKFLWFNHYVIAVNRTFYRKYGSNPKYNELLSTQLAGHIFFQHFTSCRLNDFVYIEQLPLKSRVTNQNVISPALCRMYTEQLCSIARQYNNWQEFLHLINEVAEYMRYNAQGEIQSILRNIDTDLTFDLNDSHDKVGRLAHYGFCVSFYAYLTKILSQQLQISAIIRI